MHPDIDHANECACSTTGHVFSIVTPAWGIPVLLPFLKAVCHMTQEVMAGPSHRHLYCSADCHPSKGINHVLYKLNSLVWPHIHKILVVIEPLLIDEDYYACVGGHEVISNLTKSGWPLTHMVSTICLDIDCADEYVCNTTAHAFSVVTPALGIPMLLPFLKAICHSQKLQQAHHAGVHIVQQIAIMMGCTALPHLCGLVSCVAHGLMDEQQKVQTVTALATAALAEVAAPYGIKSSNEVLWPLWLSIHQHRRKGLAAFLKAIGFIIPLMDPEYALYYMKEVMVILIHKFQMSDEEMKKIVLKVIKQCAATNGVTAQYIKQDILPDFFKLFWVCRMALDRRNHCQMDAKSWGL
ncbi:armadillo-type protein [Pisolithus orientalis]|uniref:armadillo-type protein n=1 Tax=Pisolithus orientalis TaxID=936130 RepID=UPI002224C832|nr:armadillo-type protein [Pisolithus orientalis]KAI6000116.1 armadillo-type protein [Pisolithus orientalis]